jgi:hypothetical protein
MARKFISIAQAKREETLRKLQNYYICLLIDGGICQKHHVLCILLAHPYFYPSPTFYKIVDHFQGTLQNYRTIIRSTIEELQKEHSIIVTAVTCDNLRAQVSGLTGRKSFQASEKPGNLKGVLRMSCICHTLAHAIHDVATSSDFYRCFEAIHEISILFRKKPVRSYIKVCCPGWCQTRWTNAFDIAIWMLNHHKNLVDIRINCPFFLYKELSVHFATLDYLLFESLPITLLSLFPISNLIKFIEGDNSPAAHIIHLLNFMKEQSILLAQEIRTVFEEQSPEDFSPIIHTIIDKYENLRKTIIGQIDVRMESTGNIKLVELIYMFTFEGRNKFRERNIHFILSEDHPDTFKNINPIPVYNTSKDFSKQIILFLKSLPQIQSQIEACNYQEFNQKLPQATDSDFSSLDTEELFLEEEDLLPTPLLTEESEFLEEDGDNVHNEEDFSDILDSPHDTIPSSHVIPNPLDPAPIEHRSNLYPYHPRDTPFNSTPNYEHLSEEQRAMLAIVPEIPQNLTEETNEFEGYTSLLRKIASDLDYSADEVKCTLRCFFNWVSFSLYDLSFEIMESASVHQIWRIHSQYVIWGPLSKIASRLLAIVAHEAAVEREFSKIRFNIGDLRTKTSPELREARLSLL